MSIIVALTALALAGLLLFLLLCATLASARQGAAVTHSTMGSIHSCLSPDGASIRQLLDERARANARLTKAFHLTNTFISSDTGVHSTFVTHARQLLKQSNRQGWAHFRELSIQAVQTELAELGELKPRIPYDVFIQCTCLRVILVGLLGVDASVETFKKDDLLTITNHINVLWSLSKRPEDIPSQLLPELTEALRRLIPNTERHPNPVDFVIPAWETLWRVVAIAIAYSHESEDMKDAFTSLFMRPDLTTFNGRGDYGISAKNIVDETMRLHPPSKHIGRMKFGPFVRRLPASIIRRLDTFVPSHLLYKKESADITALQQNQDIWGPDAHEFNPSRFLRYSKEQEGAFRYVFGGGPLRCAGASWAPVAVGVICSTILALLDDREELKIVRGTDIGGRDGWEGWYISQS